MLFPIWSDKRPLFPYFGSKAGLNRKILRVLRQTLESLRLSANGFHIIFGGDPSILLLQMPSALETYNDLYSDNCCLMQTLRTECSAMLAHLAGWEISVQSFQRWESAIYPQKWQGKMELLVPSSDAERAAIYYLYCHFCFNGGGTNWSTGCSQDAISRGLNFPKTEARLRQAAARLANVEISNHDFRDQLSEIAARRKYGLQIYYYDPTYPRPVRRSRDKRCRNSASRRRYVHDCMTLDDHRELAEIITATPGLHLLSGYQWDDYDKILDGDTTQKVVLLTRDTAHEEREEILWVHYRP